MNRYICIATAICIYTAILLHVYNPLTVHIIKISNPHTSEGVLLVEAATFIGGGS